MSLKVERGITFVFFSNLPEFILHDLNHHIFFTYVGICFKGCFVEDYFILRVCFWQCEGVLSCS